MGILGPNFLTGEPIMGKGDHLLIGHTIKEAIAGHNNELVLSVVDLVDPDFGLRAYLVLPIAGHVFVGNPLALMAEISEGPGGRKLPVDSTSLYSASSLLDPVSFIRVCLVSRYLGFFRIVETASIKRG